MDIIKIGDNQPELASQMADKLGEAAGISGDTFCRAFGHFLKDDYQVWLKQEEGVWFVRIVDPDDQDNSTGYEWTQATAFLTLWRQDAGIYLSGGEIVEKVKTSLDKGYPDSISIFLQASGYLAALVDVHLLDPDQAGAIGATFQPGAINNPAREQVV